MKHCNRYYVSYNELPFLSTGRKGPLKTCKRWCDKSVIGASLEFCRSWRHACRRDNPDSTTRSAPLPAANSMSQLAHFSYRKAKSSSSALSFAYWRHAARRISAAASPLKVLIKAIRIWISAVPTRTSCGDTFAECFEAAHLGLNPAASMVSGPLHLLIDATGIQAEGEWNARKAWRKWKAPVAHAPPWSGLKILEISAVGITASNVGDAPMLPGLFAQIPPDQEIAPAATDGAYDTRRCHYPSA